MSLKSGLSIVFLEPIGLPYPLFFSRIQGGEVGLPAWEEVDVPAPETPCKGRGFGVVLGSHRAICAVIFHRVTVCGVSKVSVIATKIHGKWTHYSLIVSKLTAAFT